MSRCRFRLVVFPETRRTWIARGLDHDLSAEGPTIEAAVDTLLKIARAHIAFDLRHHREPLSGFAAAPRAYWEAFARGSALSLPIQLDWLESGLAPQVIATVVTEHPGVRPVANVARTA
jgi:hypothetical protein